jgi:hypothetical protein
MINLLMQAKKGTLQGDDNGTTNGKIIKPSMYKNIIQYTILWYENNNNVT